MSNVEKKQQEAITLSKQLRYCAADLDCGGCKRWGVSCNKPNCLDELMRSAADLLEVLAGTDIAVPIKKGRYVADLTGKCGSCAHGEVATGVYGGSKCFVRCKHPELVALRKKTGASNYRRRTKTCSKYQKKE